MISQDQRNLSIVIIDETPKNSINSEVVVQCERVITIKSGKRGGKPCIRWMLAIPKHVEAYRLFTGIDASLPTL